MKMMIKMIRRAVIMMLMMMIMMTFIFIFRYGFWHDVPGQYISRDLIF